MRTDYGGSSDISASLSGLLAALEEATGADQGIDRAIAETLGVESEDYSGSAAASRELVKRVLPQVRLQVGYDVSGVFPSAVLHDAGSRYGAVAPTVPLAILRVLFQALAKREAR